MLYVKNPDFLIIAAILEREPYKKKQVEQLSHLCSAENSKISYNYVLFIHKKENIEDIYFKLITRYAVFKAHYYHHTKNSILFFLETPSIS